MDRQLYEVDVAKAYGHRTMPAFKRALRNGDVTPPTRFVGKGKKKTAVWSASQVEAHIKGLDLQEPTEGDLLQKIEDLE